MPKWTFTKDDIPAFVYLIDCILDDNQKVTIGRKQLYQNIADDVLNSKGSISSRTVERVFGLREQLKIKEDLTIKNVHKPELETLNVITRFYFESNEMEFLKYKSNPDYTKRISAYYDKNKVNEKILDVLFKELPPKIGLYQKQISQLEELLEELKGESLEGFIGNYAEQLQRTSPTFAGDREFKNEMERLIIEKISTAEAKMKNAALWYRWLGGIGLLFAGKPQLTDIKEWVVAEFLNNYEEDSDISEEDTDYEDDEDDYGDIL